MISILAGLTLAIFSIINHSILSNNVTLEHIKIKRVIFLNIWFMIALILHAVCLFTFTKVTEIEYKISIIIISLPIIAANLLLLKYLINNYSVLFRREGFEVIIYTLVLVLTSYHLPPISSQSFVLIDFILAVLTISTTIYLQMYTGDLTKLVDSVDLSYSAKIFTFASLLLAEILILIDFISEGMLMTLLLMFFIFILIFYISVLHELYKKYLSPLSEVS